MEKDLKMHTMTTVCETLKTKHYKSLLSVCALMFKGLPRYEPMDLGLPLLGFPTAAVAGMEQKCCISL